MSQMTRPMCVATLSAHQKVVHVRRIHLLFNFSLKVGLVLVALGEAALIYLSDFSGYMFDVVILTMALVMTVYCFMRAIRNYSDDVKKLGL
jgi:hypothetical protein